MNKADVKEVSEIPH
nr:hypothetical protein [Enterobacter hormaechei]